MGKDIEIVAYRGREVSDDVIAQLVSRFAPDTEWFRHAVATAVRAPIANLHCVAFYESVSAAEPEPEPDSESESDSESAPASAPAKLFFPEDMLRDAQRTAAAGGSLASVVQAAWSITRNQVRKIPAPEKAEEAEPENGALAIARELSKRCDEVFLVGYADHSCIGIYAQFRNGELISPAAEDDVYAEHDDYTRAPERAWSTALGRPVEIDEVAAAYFPDDKQPPLHTAEAARTIPFDKDRFMMTLAE